MVETCPHCGAVMSQPTIFKSKIKQAIFDYIRRHAGCGVSDIMNYVYQDDPNGGPESSNVIGVHLTKMRKKLKGLGMNITSNSGRGGGNYRIVKLEPTE